MPIEVDGDGFPLGALWQSDEVPVVAQQGILKASGPVCLVGDEQHALIVEGECPEVEQFVVEHAQGQQG